MQTKAQDEILRFTEEAERCYLLADRYTGAAELALKQVEGWQQYLSEITLRAVLPEQRKPERHLTIVKEII